MAKNDQRPQLGGQSANNSGQAGMRFPMQQKMGISSPEQPQQMGANQSINALQQAQAMGPQTNQYLQPPDSQMGGMGSGMGIGGPPGGGYMSRGMVGGGSNVAPSDPQSLLRRIMMGQQ